MFRRWLTRMMHCHAGRTISRKKNRTVSGKIEDCRIVFRGAQHSRHAASEGETAPRIRRASANANVFDPIDCLVAGTGKISGCDGDVHAAAEMFVKLARAHRPSPSNPGIRGIIVDHVKHFRNHLRRLGDDEVRADAHVPEPPHEAILERPRPARDVLRHLPLDSRAYFFGTRHPIAQVVDPQLTR
jgi:hypothetical protein